MTHFAVILAVFTCLAILWLCYMDIDAAAGLALPVTCAVV